MGVHRAQELEPRVVEVRSKPGGTVDGSYRRTAPAPLASRPIARQAALPLRCTERTTTWPAGSSAPAAARPGAVAEPLTRVAEEGVG